MVSAIFCRPLCFKVQLLLPLQSCFSFLAGMVLVFCPKITNRTRYTIELVFKTILGLDFAITTNQVEYAVFGGARLNYSSKSMDGNEVFIESSGFLEKRGIERFYPEFRTLNGLPCLFANNNMACNARFDPFAAIFYLVSRYEEYCNFKPDRHGRFAAEESFAYKNNFLQVPVANHYAILIGDLLATKNPGLVFNKPAYSYISTYDVDVAFAYKGRGVIRTLAASAIDLAGGNMKRLKDRISVLTNKQKDPYDSFDYTLSHDSKHDLRSFYFLLCGDYGPFDRNISPYSNAFNNLVKTLGDYAFCGLHPSYQSNKYPEKLLVEKERLSKILNREIRFSRQHFLKFKLPETYQNLLKHNIDNDFSMGYASQLGFRASIATPFNFYNLEREESTPLKIFPLALMDTTLKSYLKLEPEHALKKGIELVDEVKKVGGTFISLWHNETLSNSASSQPWRDCYEKLAMFALPKKSDQ
jgi:hypothetical protein